MAKEWQMDAVRMKNTVFNLRAEISMSKGKILWQSKRIDQLEASIKALVKRKRAAEHIGELIRPKEKI